MKFKTVVLCLKLLTCFILQRSFGNIVIKILSSMIKKWQVEKNQKSLIGTILNSNEDILLTDILNIVNFTQQNILISFCKVYCLYFD